MQDAKQETLEYIALEIKHAKINLAHAERRKGVTEAELDSLRRKVKILEGLQDLVLKEGD